MLAVFSPIFLVDTNVIFAYNFEAPLLCCRKIRPSFFSHDSTVP